VCEKEKQVKETPRMGRKRKKKEIPFTGRQDKKTRENHFWGVHPGDRGRVEQAPQPGNVNGLAPRNPIPEGRTPINVKRRDGGTRHGSTGFCFFLGFFPLGGGK